MVFVHARNATIRTANVMKEMALQNGTQQLFAPEGNRTKLNQKAFGKAHNKHLDELLSFGFSVHHAGMLRSDRQVLLHEFFSRLLRI